jgi:hypothetical protein
MSNEWHYLSDEERNEEHAAGQQATQRDEGVIGAIKSAFRSFASPFVSGDRRPNRPTAADREQQRDLNDEETRR